MAYQTPLILNSGQTERLQSGDILTDRRWVDVTRCGFLNQTETSLSFNDSTYVFTLTDAGSGWSYYRQGGLYTISGNKTVTLTGTPPTAGLWFIYIDATDGTLSASQTAWTLQDGKIPVAIIAWDSTLTPKYHLQEERHTCLIDRRDHMYLHNTRGSQYITGGQLKGYTIATDTDAANTFSINQAVIADEDIYLTLAEMADGDGSDADNYTIFYRTAASTWVWAYSDMPFSYTSSGYINWDSSGTLTQGTGGTGANVRYYNSYVIFTNISGQSRFVIVPGQHEYTSAATAYGEVFANFALTGIPMIEWVAMYQLTWETGASGLTNKGKCHLMREPQRIIQSAITASQTTPVAHNSLSGLQGGTTNEYYHLTSAQNTLVAGATSTPTASSIPVADGSNKLAVGWLPTVTTVGDPGSDSYLPTEQAVREAFAGITGDLPNGYNSLTYVYKDAATITVAANGQAVTADGSVTHTLTADTDLSLATGLDTGSEASNTLYYVWIGTVTGTVTLKFSTSSSSPTGLTNPVRLRGAVRNNNSSDIIPFFASSTWYQYDIDTIFTGSDVTEVLDATVSTSFVDVNCSGFVPAGQRNVLFGMSILTDAADVRTKGSAITTGRRILNASGSDMSDRLVQVSAAGIFEIKLAGSSTLRVSVIGYTI